MEKITDKERIKAVFNLPLKPLAQRIEEGDILGNFYFHTPYDVVFSFLLRPSIFKEFKEHYERCVVILEEKYLKGKDADGKKYEEKFIEFICECLADALEVENYLIENITSEEREAMWNYNPYTVDRINFKGN